MTDIGTRVGALTPDQRASLRRRLWRRGGRVLDPAEATAPAPASFTQRRMAFLQERDPHSSAYNTAAYHRVRGPLDLDALASALTDVVARHEVLRTTLPVREGEVVQHVHPPAPVEVPVVDLTALPLEQREARVRELALREQERPFALGVDAVLRCRVLLLAVGESVLLLTCHHAVVDGWAFNVLLRELDACYGARSAGRVPDLPPPRIQYGDYARWQRDWADGDDARRQVAFWREQLAGAPEILDLPTATARAAVRDWHADEVVFHVPAAVRDGVVRLAAETSATPFMVLLTAFQTVLAHYSGQDDVVVGTPVANRRYEEFHDLVGFFANNLPLRARIDRRQPFRDQLAAAVETCLAAYENQDVPLDELARRLAPERTLGRNPLFQTSIALHNSPTLADTLAGLALEPLDPGLPDARFDLDLHFWPVDDGLDGRMIYPVELFERSTMVALARSFELVLAAAADDSDTPVGALQLMDATARAAVLAAASGAGTPSPRRCLHELVAERARATPDAVAIVAADGTTTSYAELTALADRFAVGLARRGVRRGDVVAVHAGRTPVLPAVLLGVLRTGAAYVPLDPAQPAVRIAHVLADSGARLVVTESPYLDATDGIAVVPVTDCLAPPGSPVPPVDGTPDDLMYVIYTSGTTGGPKGVALTHRQVLNYLLWAARAYDLGRGTGVPVLTSPGADLTVTSLFGPLLAGGRLLFFDESATAGGNLRDCADRARDLTMVKLTPTHFRILETSGVPAGWAAVLVMGGEQLPPDQLAHWRRCLPDAEVVNEYGPTETAIGCTAGRDDPASTRDRVGIGEPIDNMTVHVLDESLEPVPPGVVGEIHVGGSGVAVGYWRRPAQTAAAFVPDPFGTAPGARLYRTGDLARRRPDGSLECLGRRDRQLKVRGTRVEPEEVAAAVAAVDVVRQAVVAVETDVSGTDHLVAFVTTDKVPEELGERLDAWREVYDRTYRDLGDEDPTFNLAGWTSSYTGAPIDPAEMRCWLDDTMAAIRALDPRDVLEIGCGTGMVASGLLPDARTYHGTDISPRAIDHLRRTLPSDTRVTLAVAAAHESVPAGATYDTVVLNSVIQYFPSAEYLTDVLTAAVAAVRPGGHVFLGDVRDLGLLPMFHLSVEADHAPARTRLGELRALVTQRIDNESELCVHPSFFIELGRRLARVAEVRVSLKPGAYRNELSCFRYDVVLAVAGEDVAVAHPADVLDWANGMDLESLLGRRAPGPLVVRNVPNERVAPFVALADAVNGGSPHAVLDDVRREHRGGVTVTPSPDELLAAARRAGYDAGASRVAGRPDGSFDLLLAPTGMTGAVSWAPPDLPARPATNDPGWPATAARLVARLRRELPDVLPSALVPTRIRVLRGIPTDPVGKVDHASLRWYSAAAARLADGGREPSRPLTATETRIAAIWSEVLGRAVTDPEDDFFALGGHSLLTFQLVFRLGEELGRQIPVRAPFEAPTLAGLAALVDGLTGDAAPVPAPVPVPRTARMPMSRGQARLWFLHQLDAGNVDYNAAVYVRLLGDLDVDALRHALSTVVERHEVLRTVLDADDGNPFQQVLPARPVDVRTIPLVDLPPDQRRSAAVRLAQEELHRPFDLARPPVLRVAVLHLGDREHVLLLTLHHSAYDGWSAGVLLDEFAELYDAAIAGRRPELPDLPVQYADYAVWQQELLASAWRERAVRYWSEVMAGVADLPRLPTPLARSARAGQHSAVVNFAVPTDVRAALAVRCRDADATVFMATLTAMAAALWRHTGHTDLVIGGDVAGRPSPALRGLIGFFVNEMVLRVRMAGATTWRALLAHVRDVVLGAYDYQELPIDEVVKVTNPRRVEAGRPLFDVKLTFDNTPKSTRTLSGLEFADFDFGFDTIRVDLLLAITHTGEELSGSWRYDTALYDERTVRALCADWLMLLRSLATEPDRLLTELPDAVH